MNLWVIRTGCNVINYIKITCYRIHLKVLLNYYLFLLTREFQLSAKYINQRCIY
jgi:hypothetical protein